METHVLCDVKKKQAKFPRP